MHSYRHAKCWPNINTKNEGSEIAFFVETDTLILHLYTLYAAIKAVVSFHAVFISKI